MVTQDPGKHLEISVKKFSKYQVSTVKGWRNKVAVSKLFALHTSARSSSDHQEFFVFGM